MYDTLWITFFLALILSFAVSPLSIKLAPKVGAMDIPKDKRRMHKKAMPRFGGLAIFVGSTVSMLVFLSYDPKMVAITIGGVLIYILGIVDDIRGLSPAMKFLGELAVAIVIYVNDIRIEFITNFFGQGNSQLGDALCFIVTVVWIVGITCLLYTSSFDRVLDEETGQTTVVPDSFQYTEKTPVGPFDMFVALPKGCIQVAQILFIMIFAYYWTYSVMQSGALSALFNKLLTGKTKNNKFFIPICMTVFSDVYKRQDAVFACSIVY